MKEQDRSLTTRLSLATALGLGLASTAVVGFVALADHVVAGRTSAMDQAVMQTILGARAEWLDVVALQVTALGNLATLTVVALAAIAILWAADRKVSVGLLLACGLTTVGVERVLKHAFDRPRPDAANPMVEVLSPSFPSGHAMGAAVIYGTVAFLVGRMATGGVRWATWVSAVVLTIFVGVSRVYLGVHHPSDVVAGWLAGIAWTTLLVLLFRHFGSVEATATPPPRPRR